MKIGLYYIPRSLYFCYLLILELKKVTILCFSKYLACGWNYNIIEIYLPFHRERNHGHDGDIRDKLAKD